MELTWYGLSCFRLTERKLATIVTDPYSSKSGLPALKLKADVVTVSHDAPGHSAVSAVSGQSHTLNGPGEYEIGNVFIQGIDTYGDDDERNLMFVYNFGGIAVAHLGDLKKVPTQKQVEALEMVNVLLLPVGGGNSLTAAQAAEIVSMLEPNIVVPMHYKIDGLKYELDEVDRFLNEMGVSEITEESSLKVSLSGLPEETETVLLVPKI